MTGQDLEQDGIYVRVDGDRATVTITAAFDLVREEVAHLLLRQALRAGAVDLEFDFCPAPFVGGAAVRLVLAGREAGGSVTVRASGHARRIFDVTGLSDLVTMADC